MESSFAFDSLFVLSVDSRDDANDNGSGSL